MFCQRMPQQDEYARRRKEREQESRRMKETKAATGERENRREKKKKRMRGRRRRRSNEETRKENKDLGTTPIKITLLPNPEASLQQDPHALNITAKHISAEKPDNLTFDAADDATDDEADEAYFGEPEDFEDARSVITELANALDAEEGPPENSDEITQLIRYLSFGVAFDEGCCDAYDRGQKRLANIMSYVRWARREFVGVTSSTQILTQKQLEKVHNDYRDSNIWMPEDVWKKYKSLLDSTKKGSNQEAHQHRRKTYNVFLFKLTGAKALFFHFIKVGTERININELLTEWTTFKSSEEYKKMLARSSEKSAEEKQAKTKRDRIRAELKIMQEQVFKRRRPEDVESMQTLLQQLQEAKREYEKTGRAGRSSSVASFLPDT